MSFKKMVTGKYEVCSKQMSVMEYAEELLNGYDFDHLFDAMHHGGGYDEKKMLKYIEDMAKHRGVTLTGKDDVDEDALYDMYKTAGNPFVTLSELNASLSGAIPWRTIGIVRPSKSQYPIVE